MDKKNLNLFFTFSLDETNLILKGLGKLLGEESFVITNKIMSNAQNQIKQFEMENIEEPKQEIVPEMTIEEPKKNLKKLKD